MDEKGLIIKLSKKIKGDFAMQSRHHLMPGGIDLTPTNASLETQLHGGAIKFHLDQAMLARLQNASGFVPVIINIQPLNDLKQFLGIGVRV
jgi:hypothetical protein